jgi:hypothetical protein
MEHGDGSWEKQQYQTVREDEYTSYTGEARDIALVFDDYATQLEALAKTAREVANDCDDAAGTDHYEFWDRYPDFTPGYPAFDELEDIRTKLLADMRSLAVQIREDLNEAIRRGY